MAYTLGDIYIGNFPITQSFGARPDTYSARYGIKSHNGIDIGCPNFTPILSTADGVVYKIGTKANGGFDTAGYGTYIKIVHEQNGKYFKTTYAHLDSVAVNQGDRVVKGQLIGQSNNSGFSDGAHLHFGIAPCRADGVDLEPGNGWAGYINPMDTNLCVWDITNLKQPVNPVKQEDATKIPVPSSDFTRMVAQGSNYKVIASWAIDHGVNEYLSSAGKSTIDLNTNPNDPTGGENITRFLSDRLAELKELKTKLEQTNTVSNRPQDTTSTSQNTIVVQSDQAVTEEQAKQIIETATPLTDLLKKVFNGVKGFIFVSK